MKSSRILPLPFRGQHLPMFRPACATHVLTLALFTLPYSPWTLSLLVHPSLLFSVWLMSLQSLSEIKMLWAAQPGRTRIHIYVIYWFWEIAAAVLGVMWGILTLWGCMGVTRFYPTPVFSKYLQLHMRNMRHMDAHSKMQMTSFALFLVMCIIWHNFPWWKVFHVHPLGLLIIAQRSNYRGIQPHWNFRDPCLLDLKSVCWPSVVFLYVWPKLFKRIFTFWRSFSELSLTSHSVDTVIQYPLLTGAVVYFEALLLIFFLNIVI